MIQIRALIPSDVDRLYKIWEEFYKDEFPFPNFFKNFLAGFVVENEDGAILTAGGVKLITEVVLVTNKNFPVRERREALLKVLDASRFINEKFGHDFLNVFVEPGDYENQLKRYGFRDAKGRALVYG